MVQVLRTVEPSLQLDSLWLRDLPQQVPAPNRSEISKGLVFRSKTQVTLDEVRHYRFPWMLRATVEAGSTAAVTIVLAAPDYPERNDVGTPIQGVDEAAAGGALVFHAGTAMRGDTLVTNGGRILNVTGVGQDLAAARASAYEGVGQISFPGMRYRSDIAAEAEARVG